MRIDECLIWLDADHLGRALNLAGLDGTVVLLAGWQADRLRLQAGDKRLRTRLRELEGGHLIWVVSHPLPVRPDRLRWTFECPLCGRGCRRVYARWDRDRLLCRVCHRLSYESAQVWDNEARRGWPGGLLGRMCHEIARGGDGTAAITRAAKRDSRLYSAGSGRLPAGDATMTPEDRAKCKIDDALRSMGAAGQNPDAIDSSADSG